MAVKMVALLLLAIVAATMAPMGHGLPDDQSPVAVERWFRLFPYATPRLTKLHFYLHNLASRNPPASTPVARANTTDTSPTKFGLISAVDAPLTAQPKSGLIGYGQGLFSFTSQEELSSLMTHNFVFTAAPYAGSTLAVVGRNPVNAKYREFPIIGGSGDFRLAQGICTASTYDVTPTGDDTLEITCLIYRYVLPAGGLELESESGLESESEYATEQEIVNLKDKLIRLS